MNTIEQVGPTLEIRQRPATKFVAEFIAACSNVVPPIVFFLEAQNLADFAVGKRRLVANQFSAVRGLGAQALEESFGWLVGSDRVVGGVEDLEAEAVFAKAKMDDLGEVASVDIGPGVAFTRGRIGKEGAEILVHFG